MVSVQSKMKKRPLERVTKPRSGVFMVYVDFWWAIEDESILLYKGRHPQCNQERALVDALRDRLHPNAETRQIPVVYLPVERGEW